VACFDELPVQLIDDVGEEVPMKGGKPARFAYEDARGGAASWRVAFEPLTGKWLVGTSKQGTKADYCRFQRRVAALFPAAAKVVPVPDKLNTPNAGALYEDLPPAEAFASAQPCEFHSAPKRGSWLNLAELELSAPSRLCLSRRLGWTEGLDREIQALVKERNELMLKGGWQFSLPRAREKLSRH
jgi:DDE superfamily endonuclease